MNVRLVALSALLAACDTERPAPERQPPSVHVHDPDEPASTHRPDTTLVLRITPAGLEPADAQVSAGASTSLVVTRTSDKACAPGLLVYFTSGASVYRDVNVAKPETIVGTFDRTGTLAFECDAGRVGRLTVR